MATHSTTVRQGIPRELAWAGVLALIALAAAILLGQARVLPAPAGEPYQVDAKTMLMDRAAP